MESNIDWALKYSRLQDEHMTLLNEQINIIKQRDDFSKELSIKQCELLREIGECNSLIKEREALKAHCDKMEAALLFVKENGLCSETTELINGALAWKGKEVENGSM